MISLSPQLASQFAQMTLGHLGLRYPYKLDLVLAGPEDLIEPSHLHPIFYGSFDWHSCVHGWWQVMRLARLYPDLPEVLEIRRRADVMLVPTKVLGELARLDRPHSLGFERPYGWSWLLALHGELALHGGPWAEALEPLARRFAAMFKDYLPKLTYPIITGTHYNTAFAIMLAHRWARIHDAELLAAAEDYARRNYLPLADYRGLEPGGDEFLSPALSIALLMSEVLEQTEFAIWFGKFLPQAASLQPPALFEPVIVSDRSDGKIAHLDGLNLSRAWAFRRLATALAQQPLTDLLSAAHRRHVAASLPHIGDDYMGSHWLASFALLALED
jgi:hypothetical protein